MNTPAKTSPAKTSPLTISELASLYSCSRSTVYKWVARGCPCFTTNGKSPHSPYTRVYFNASEVENWHKSFTRPVSLYPKLRR